MGAGTECDENTSDTCDGGVITYCMWGVKTTLDCKTYGLSGCTTVSASLTPGQVVAECTP